MEEVLLLVKEEYHDLNMRHFHKKLREEHKIELSYTFARLSLRNHSLFALVLAIPANLAPPGSSRFVPSFQLVKRNVLLCSLRNLSFCRDTFPISPFQYFLIDS